MKRVIVFFICIIMIISLILLINYGTNSGTNVVVCDTNEENVNGNCQCKSSFVKNFSGNCVNSSQCGLNQIVTSGNCQ